MKRLTKSAERPTSSIEIPLAEITSVFPNTMKRLRPDLVDRLVDSMGRVGLIEALLVRPRRDGGYQLVDGRHRLQAAQQLGWKKIRATVRAMTNAEAELAMIDSNLVVAPLSPAERRLLELTREDLVREEY